VDATDVKIFGGGLVDSDYQLAQFHFHWGNSSSSGSEHTLNGKHAALEVCIKFQTVGLCFVYPMLPVSLDCPFLIAPSVFSNVYLALFIIC
jgi:hypothetical protein